MGALTLQQTLAALEPTQQDDAVRELPLQSRGRRRATG